MSQQPKLLFSVQIDLNKPCIILLLLLILQLILMGTFGGFYYYPFLNLMVPFIVLINCLFFIFWIIKLKWPFVMFIFSILIGHTEWERLYKLPNNAIPVSKGLKLMSFNVRLFNSYNWIDKENIPESILSFVNQESPDILCLQEFSKEFSPSFEKYPYNYMALTLSKVVNMRDRVRHSCREFNFRVVFLLFIVTNG